MKLVYTIKATKRCKVRAVVCGDMEEHDPSQQLWTAQAEPASMSVALRLSLLRGWQPGAVDVSGAFMYAPLPEQMLVLARPPRAFIDAGLAKHDEWRALHRAVCGLRASPRAWGTERDKTLRTMAWEVDGDTLYLQQCTADTQFGRSRSTGARHREG